MIAALLIQAATQASQDITAVLLLLATIGLPATCALARAALQS